VSAPLVTVSVLVYGPSPWLARVVDALRANTAIPYELVLVDNGTTAETREYLAGVEHARVLRPDRNLGFGVGHDAAANVARAPYFCALNSDAVVPPGWLDALVAPLAADPSVGATAPVYVYPDGRLQEAGAAVEPSGRIIAFGRFDDAADARYRLSGRMPFASAACMVMRTADFRAAGGFDPRYGLVYYEDVDLVFALLARGLHVELVADVQVVHAQGASSAPEDAERRLLGNRERFRRRYQSLLTGRPDVFGRPEAHHLAAARDFDACDRVLVVRDPLDAVAARFVEACRARLRDGRVTVVVEDDEGDGDTSDWLARGVEVVAARELDALLTARRFHYAAVVAFPAVNNELERIVRDTQPQARLTGPPAHATVDRGDEFDRWLGSLDLVPRLVS
jgi:GT2 family glycosyltransferase